MDNFKKTLLFNKVYYNLATFLGAFLIFRSGFFNKKYYLLHNPDVSEAKVNPFLHYLFRGGIEGRNPGPDFHSSFYTSQYADVRISCLNPLIHYLLYGRSLGRQCKTVRGDLKISFRKEEVKTLTKILNVIVPVFVSNPGSLQIFKELINSIKCNYPIPQRLLKFIIIDDHSTFTDCFSYYRDEPFFSRNDVLMVFSGSNLGFGATVNLGLSHTSADSDVVLLNSDTMVFSDNFEILQNVALRNPDVASVTPLSNKATIASLINWPYGEKHINDYSHFDVARKINDLKLVNQTYPLPTGHGFCMYLTRKALDKTGLFDDEVFGRGYGEENDWCQRAQKLGMIHLITTETYVFHHDTTSFTDVEKQTLIAKNLQIIEKKYPQYHHTIHHLIQTDPLSLYRSVIQVKLTEIIKAKYNYSTIAFFLHNDPFSYKGGTEVHVMDLIESLLKNSDKFEIFVFYPKSNDVEKTVSVRYFSIDGKHDLNLWFDSQQFNDLLDYFSIRLDYIHIHHFLGWDQKVINWLQTVKVKQKIITLHDFRAFCINPCLIFTDGKYCRFKGDIDYCKKCFEKAENESREGNLKLLSQMDKILVPSTSAQKVIKELAETKDISSKIVVLPHSLPFVDRKKIKSSSIKDGKNLIVFLGGAAEVKGIRFFLEAAIILEKKGFRCEIWGYGSSFTSNIRTYPYKGFEELIERNRQPHIVIMPSIWPETFSYTLFEALFILEAPVIVGPFGNPADFVKSNKVGEVLNEITANDLVEAVTLIDCNYLNYKRNVFEILKKNDSNYQIDSYISNYMSLLGVTKSNLFQPIMSISLLSSEKQIVLHIAMPKTGSSALQAFFALNINELQKSGVYYPKPEPFKQPYQTSSGNGIFLSGLIEQNNQSEINEFIQKNLEVTEKILLISSEQLFHRLRQFPEAFFQTLRNFPINIVCYVRRQDELYSSIVNQLIKNHNAKGIDIGLIKNNHDFTKVLLTACSYILAERIIVRPYEKEQFTDGNIFDDFCSIIGITRNESFKLPDDIVNPSLSMQVLEYRRLLNCLEIDSCRASKKYKNNSLLADYTVQSGLGRSFLSENIFSYSKRVEILKEYQKPNEVIANTFLRGNNGVLFLNNTIVDGAFTHSSADNDHAFGEITKFIYEKNKSLALEIFKQLKLQKLNNKVSEAVQKLLPVFVMVINKVEQEQITFEVERFLENESGQ